MTTYKCKKCNNDISTGINGYNFIDLKIHLQLDHNMKPHSILGDKVFKYYQSR